jgi:hypothetical protein
MDFYTQHGVLTLICLAVFPRLTLLLGSFVTGGVLWWLGWLIAPHLLVAILALPYWDKNPELVIIAWCIAFGGTSAESKAATRRQKS